MQWYRCKPKSKNTSNEIQRQFSLLVFLTCYFPRISKTNWAKWCQMEWTCELTRRLLRRFLIDTNVKQLIDLTLTSTIWNIFSWLINMCQQKWSTVDSYLNLKLDFLDLTHREFDSSLMLWKLKYRPNCNGKPYQNSNTRSVLKIKKTVYFECGIKNSTYL